MTFVKNGVKFQTIELNLQHATHTLTQNVPIVLYRTLKTRNIILPTLARRYKLACVNSVDPDQAVYPPYLILIYNVNILRTRAC